MKLFDLIDRWHQRKVLLRLIKKIEKEIKYNRSLLKWVPHVQPNIKKQDDLVKYIPRMSQNN